MHSFPDQCIKVLVSHQGTGPLSFTIQIFTERCKLWEFGALKFLPVVER